MATPWTVEPTSTRNDIDMILDIPVQMTVELGRTKPADVSDKMRGAFLANDLRDLA